VNVGDLVWYQDKQAWIVSLPAIYGGRYRVEWHDEERGAGQADATYTEIDPRPLMPPTIDPRLLKAWDEYTRSGGRGALERLEIIAGTIANED
jgi:hypothetical protein